MFTTKFVLVPLQIVAVPVMAAAVGLAFTVTTALPEGLATVHPFASVTDVKV